MFFPRHGRVPEIGHRHFGEFPLHHRNLSHVIVSNSCFTALSALTRCRNRHCRRLHSVTCLSHSTFPSPPDPLALTTTYPLLRCSPLIFLYPHPPALFPFLSKLDSNST